MLLYQRFTLKHEHCIQGYLQEFETGGGYRQKFEGCKHERKSNLHLKALKNRKNDIQLAGGWGCRLSTGVGGVYTLLGGGG